MDETIVHTDLSKINDFLGHMFEILTACCGTSESHPVWSISREINMNYTYHFQISEMSFNLFDQVFKHTYNERLGVLKNKFYRAVWCIWTLLYCFETVQELFNIWNDDWTFGPLKLGDSSGCKNPSNLHFIIIIIIFKIQYAYVQDKHNARNVSVQIHLYCTSSDVISSVWL